LALIRPFAEDEDEKFQIVCPCDYDKEKFGSGCTIKPFGCFKNGHVLIANDYYQLILLNNQIPEADSENGIEESTEYPELDRFEMPE